MTPDTRRETVQSSSNPKQFYTVTFKDDEPMHCTCTGFMYRQTCRHVKAFLEDPEDEQSNIVKFRLGHGKK